MILRNVSTRNIVLFDTPGNQYNLASYGDLTVSDSLWTDNEFRRWVRARWRDVVIVPSAANHASSHTSGGLDAITGTLDANARLNVLNNTSSIGTRRSVNFIPGTNISYTIADNSGNERVDVTVNASAAGASGVGISKNGGSQTAARPQLNLIEGTGISLTTADNSGASRVDITIASTGAITLANEAEAFFYS